jgi:hypothetical protein
VLASHPVVVVVGKAHQTSDDWVEELGNERHQCSDCDDIDGESTVVLQEVLVATQRQTNEHAVGDTGYHVHGIIPDRDVLVVFGVKAPCRIETMDDFVVDIRNDAVDSACQTFVDHSLVEDGFQQIYEVIRSALLFNM